jgi:preprotein translocase subunit SecF
MIGTVNAQDKSQKVSNDLSSIIDKSNNFKEYKVVEKKAIVGFQSTLNNFIKQEQNLQASLRSQLSANEKKISVLEKQMEDYKSKNEKLVAEKANINFLGFSISKENYSITMWALFLGALAVAVILFLSFKRANKITKESKTILRDLEDEYQLYRGSSVEREQNLRRQLFDEVKKNKDLKSVS